MSPRLRLSLLASLAAAALLPAASHAQSARALYDARRSPAPARPTAAESALLTRVVRPAAARAWRGVEGCEAEFEVVDATSGAFTRAGASERAFLYRYCSTGRQFAKMGLVIAERGAVTVHLAYEGGSEHAIGAVPDLNGDGLADLVVAANGLNQGVTWGVLRVWSLAGGRVGDLGILDTYEDDCGARERGGAAMAYRLLVQAGGRPRFFAESFESACAPIRWRPSGTRRAVTPRDAGQMEFRSLL